MKTKYTSILLRFALLSLVFVVEGRGLAASVENITPQWFQRIMTMEEITDGGIYLIGAVYPKDRHFYLMSSETQKGNWLVAVDKGKKNDAPYTLSLENAEQACIWRFCANTEGKIALVECTNGKALYHDEKENKKNHLLLSETDTAFWFMAHNDETFSLTLDTASNYYITIDLQTLGGSKSGMRYGYYSNSSFNSHDLYLYKAISDDANDVDARATLMENGATVAICSKSALATADFATMSPDGILLQNGTLAADERVGEWTYESRGDSSFVLRNAEGKSLGYDLQPSEEQQVWRISNGRIVTNGNAGTARSCALCFDDSFKLVDVDSIKTERRVKLREVVQSDSAMSAEVKTLSGGWTSERLAAINWDGVQTLDLTGISLPVVGLTNFTHRPAEANTIIFINKESADVVPADWNFTVVRREDGDTLLTTTHLHDREKLCVAQNISYSAGQLSYQRELHNDTAWETLYVPFSADVDDDYVLCQFKSLSDDALTFEKTTTIPAYTPLLLRRKSEEAATTFLVTASADGVLYSLPVDTQETFIGTLASINISSASEGKYLLNTAGEAFQLAGAGSTLKPFRAYIQQSSTSSTLRLKFDGEATNIAPAASTEADNLPQPCYTIDGRLISPHMSRQAVYRLPRGLYIYGGKTLIVR